MKNFCILLSFLLLFIFQFNSQNILFSEDFQQVDLNDWTILKLDNNTMNSTHEEYQNQPWLLRIDNEDINDTVMSASSFFTTQTQANRWLISPLIQLGNSGNVLSWNAKSLDPSFPDNYVVLVSNGGTSPEDFTDTLSVHIIEDYIWTNHVFSLSALGLNNQSIRVAFVLNSIDGYELFIDDIEVRENDPLQVFENKMNNKKDVYFSNQILYSNELISSILIRDLNGKIVYESKNSFFSRQFDFLHEGCYFFEMEINNQTFRLKVLI
ncbi:MAG: choice-of-anchor J domain-containing protein [Flavobacteriia bacterium]|nr:choice-of-anchor J domain-containing protein [Flavobacteriia bacterium]